MSSMNSYPELSLAREDMRQQSPLYQPSLFWDAASDRIVQELCEGGIENFRRLPKPLGFFAPTYGPPGSSLTDGEVSDLEAAYAERCPEKKKQQMTLRHLLGGEAFALADYRVLLAADDESRLPHLHTFSECDFGAPVEHFEFDGRRFSRSALNYLLGLAFLKRYLGDDVPRTVMEIGGGFGTLGEILAKSGIDGLRYVDLDIPPTSFVAQSYLTAALGGERVSTYAGTRELEEIEIASLKTVSTLGAWQIEKLRGKVDLFVNFISFQEMEAPIVQNYLKHVDRLQAKFVLLRNLREGKAVKSERVQHGVEKPILGGDYDGFLSAYDLLATNVRPFGYRTIDGFHSELRLYKRREG